MLTQPASSVDFNAAVTLVTNRGMDELHTDFRARWIDTVEELEALKKPWDDLTKSAFQENLYFQPEFLIPAFKFLNDVDARVLVIEARDEANENKLPVLCALVPLIRKRFYHLPLSCYEIWCHELSVDSTPLFRRDCAAAALRFTLDFLRAEGASLLSLDTVSADPEFKDLLDQAIDEKELTVFVRDGFSRAEFRRASSADEYLEANTSKNVRKKLRRYERRLNEKGKLCVSVSDPSSDFAALAEQFLELEASGWKGKQGTALGVKPSTRNFFIEMVQRSAESGTIKFLNLNLDGQPIAILCDLENGPNGCAFKATYDESYSQYSPGLLAEFKNVHYLHQSTITKMDSCTSPNNASINRIWAERKEFQSLVIALKGGLPSMATAFMPTIQAAVKSAKRLLGR